MLNEDMGVGISWRFESNLGHKRFDQVERTVIRAADRRTRWHSSWRVVELWNIAADDLLALDDPGLIPWVPLTQFEGPPEPIFRQCREQIDDHAEPNEHDNLLAVTQVLSKLRYDSPGLLAILGGRDTMFDSPLIQELVAEEKAKMFHQAILGFLEDRFAEIPETIRTSLNGIQNEAHLQELNKLATHCDDLQTFQSELDSRRAS